ncbi:MAG: hypothetical protein QOJ99_188 [Bryobacterales bacterium]|nr:hypothetical protein [Bryobacterales bacterium]
MVQGDISKALSSKALKLIGKYSYGMYVLHPFVISWLLTTGITYSIFGLFTCIILTCVAAGLSWFLLEKRFLTFKRRFEYDSRPQSHSNTGQRLTAGVSR